MKSQQQISLDKCFDNYETVQVHHLDMLKSDQTPDLEQMTKERNTVFQFLKTTLESFVTKTGMQHGDESLSILSGYETRLATLMELDGQISNEIKKYKDFLKINLNHMKKGKTAMNGYKSTGTISPKPRVLSMNQ
ncbi:MAG: hypothetical protein ABIJ31_15105 [Pseudomonadota bacterium]